MSEWKKMASLSFGDRRCSLRMSEMASYIYMGSRGRGHGPLSRSLTDAIADVALPTSARPLDMEGGILETMPWLRQRTSTRFLTVPRQPLTRGFDWPSSSAAAAGPLSAAQSPNRWNRNPRPQLVPQIRKLQHQLTYIRHTGVTKTSGAGVGQIYIYIYIYIYMCGVIEVGRLHDAVVARLYIYIYIYIVLYTCVYIYIYTYIHTCVTTTTNKQHK